MDGNTASTTGTIIRWERCWQSRTDHFQIYQAKFDLYKSLDQPKKAANVQKLIDCSSFILGEDERYSELLGFEYERLEDVVSNNCKKLDAYQNAVQILQITCRIQSMLWIS